MPERKPNITDYLASAALSYAVIFFYLRTTQTYTPPWIISYLVYYLAGLIPTYLVVRRIDRNQFPVAVIASLGNWVFTWICLVTFTQGNSGVFFKTLLLFFMMGGVTSSIVTMRSRLSPRDKPVG